MNYSGETYTILNIATDNTFYFLPFLIASSAAKTFRTNESISLSLAGALLYPSILEVAKVGEVTSYEFLGVFNVPIINYSASIIPILLGVWILSYLYNFLDEKLPSAVRTILSPLISLLIMIPLILGIIAPIGYYIGDYVAQGVTWLIEVSPLIAGFIVGGTRPLLVLTGMHHALGPIILQEIASNGSSYMSAINLMSTFAQATAALALLITLKSKKDKQISGSAAFSGYIGITEPALYGPLTTFPAAFLGASLGGAVGGAVSALLGVKSFAYVLPSILTLPAFLAGGITSLIILILAAAVSSFIFTVVLMRFMNRAGTTTHNTDTDTSTSTNATTSTRSSEV